MDEFRQTLKSYQEFSFDGKSDLFFLEFSNHDQTKESLITMENGNIPWFLSEIPYFNKNNSSHILINILNQSIDKRTNQCTVDYFVSECVKTIGQLHYDICDRDNNIKSIKESIRIIEDTIKFLNAKGNNYYQEEENCIYIDYVKDKQYYTQIFKHYQIKYKASNVLENFCSIYGENDNFHRCVLSMNSDIKEIFIQVLGKPIKMNKVLTDKEEYQVLSNISLPIIEVYTAIQPKYFKLPKIPPTFLIITYKDCSKNSPFSGENNIELKFQISFSIAQRLKILDKLLNYYQELSEDLEGGVRKRIILIEDIIFPFRKEMLYERAKGIFSKKVENRSCESVCKVF